MRHQLWLTAGLLSTRLLLPALALGRPPSLYAQAAAPPLPTWHAGSSLPGDAATQRWAWGTTPLTPSVKSPDTRSHTWTGLLIGGLVGGAATAVFLTGFCGDPDTACGADEVGRAVVLIAVPAAAAGALIGSLIRTER